ncbi:MAG: hypothetical protein ACHQYP_10505 [Nitrospiria bacterium]
MPEKKQHLKINLDFLDRESSTPEIDTIIQKKSVPETPHKVKFEFDWLNWTTLLLIIGLVVYFVWTSNNKSNVNTKTGVESGPTVNPDQKDKEPNIPAPPFEQKDLPTSNQSQPASDTVDVGEFRCSRYNYNQAVAFNPNEKEKTQLTIEQRTLERRAANIDELKGRIDSTSINEESSQYSVEEYNQLVNEYNAALATYKKMANTFNMKIDKFNSQVEAHNDYLTKNCTKIK